MAVRTQSKKETLQNDNSLQKESCPVTRWASLLAQTVKNLPAMQETLEKGMATHSSIPAWRIPWMEEPDGVQSMGLHRVGHN